MQCQLCGAEEESINHLLFECPFALQIWVLSNVPSGPGIFPTSSIFTKHGFSFLAVTKRTRFELFSLDPMVYLEKSEWKNL